MTRSRKVLLMSIPLALLPAVAAGAPTGSLGAEAACHVASAGATWQSRWDFFTNFGRYMPRVHCLEGADGRPDWPWIAALLALTSGVVVGYLKIFAFWRKSYLAEKPGDRNTKLMDLAYIFLWCAICGYVMSMVMFFWPGYRLLAAFLVVLNWWTWRFAANLGDLQVSLSAKRLQRELDETLANRNIELERQVIARTTELEEARLVAEAVAVSLRESEERCRSVVESSLDAVITMDGDGRIIGWNAQAERAFGWPRADVLGRALGETIIPQRYQAAHGAGLLRFITTGEGSALNQRLELSAMHRLGHEFPIELAIAPSRLAGEVTFNGFIRDITEAKRIQESLKRAKEKAEAATASKSEFLANMSHEIRTPMTAILGYADLLLEPGQGEAERADHIQTIRRNGEHLLSIINDILDLSKIESGRMGVEQVECSPVQVIDEAISVVRGKADQRGLQLNMEYAGPLPVHIKTDPTRLKQILVNLLGNAIKFTPAGAVRMVVRMHDGPTPAPPALVFEVIDTGIGITAEQLTGLFQPFTQGDASMTRRFGGTGLGLIISRQLARLLGGDIAAQSVPGEGSIFTLRIHPGDVRDVAMIDPVQRIPRRAETDHDRFGEARSQPRALHGVRILLAEDGPDNQRLIAFHLRRAGAVVSIAEDGRKAVNMVHRPVDGSKETPSADSFDVILMDMQMPELDGYGATMQLRWEGFDKPIIALTAHAMMGDREKCLQSGCDAYATKPIDPAGLIALIQESVHRHTGAPSGIRP